MDTVPPGPMWFILILLLFLSAVLSYVKAMASSANDGRLKALSDDGERKAEAFLKKLDKNSFKVIDGIHFVVILIGFLISGVVAFWTVSYLKGMALPISNAVMASAVKILIFLCVMLLLTYVYMTFGILLPKRLAGSGDKFAFWCVGFASFFASILKPFSYLTRSTAGGILGMFGIKPEDEEDVTEEEIRMMVDIGSESGVIDDDEKKMIHNIFELDDKTIDDIMTHRTDVEVLWEEDGIDKWEEVINETKHTRYPVCGETIDDIIGVLNSRDFYRFLLSDRSGDWKALLREPYFAPESLKANDLFRQMQDRNSHFTIVLDEYGGFRGIVTQEDLIEEIVGELYSEYDAPEEIEEITSIGDGKWRIQGWAELEAVSEALDIDLVSEDYNTFAGLILDALGEIPDDGATPEITTKGLKIKVTKIEEHRIEEAVAEIIQIRDDEDE